jgi:hypothetical protein
VTTEEVNCSTMCFLVSPGKTTLRGLKLNCRRGREEHLIRFRLPKQTVRFRLPGRAVQNPGARIHYREDSVSNLIDIRLCNQEL